MMKKIYKTLFSAAICGVITLQSAHAQNTRTYVSDEGLVPREHSVDMTNLALDVKFSPREGKVFGTVTHTFRAIQRNADTLFLDGPGIQIKSVKMGGVPQKFSVSPQGVTIRFAQPLEWEKEYSLEIDYEARPEKGIYFIGWNDERNVNRKQVWTQGQGTDNRYWIPMYDGLNDKVTTDIRVTFEKGYSVLSNGTLTSKKENRDNTVTWQYRMSRPHSTYLIMLGIGDYRTKSMRSASGTPIQLWYYPDMENRADITYKYSVEMFDFFEREIGVPYPWETYSQIPVQDFMYGAMENTTATLFGDFFMVDRRGYNDRNYVAVNAHELAHQWFGDLVTARSPAHHWLQESFATHYNLTYEREAFGKDHFDWQRRSSMLQALDAAKSDNYPVGCSYAGTARWYPKGAIVLEMLKYVTGREEFNKAIKAYLNAHAYKNVDAQDLLVAFHETLGKSLDWFWEEWIYRGGEPEYNVSYKSYTDKNGNAFTEFFVEQVHPTSELTGLFRMPVWFEVHYKDGSADKKLEWISQKTHRVLVPNTKGQPVTYTLFDPNSNVLKKVTFVKEMDELFSQALNAENMLDRHEAVLAMRGFSADKKIELFHKIYDKETFYGIRAEMINQVTGSDLPRCKELVTKSLKSQDVQLRKLVLQPMSSIDDEQAKIIEGYFADPEASYDLLVRSLELLVAHDAANAKKYLNASSDLIGNRGRNFRIKWLEMGIQHTQHGRLYQQELIAFTSPSYEFLTRINAMDALGRLSICNEEIIANICEAVTSSNSRLSGPAANALRDYYRRNSYRMLIDQHLGKSNLSQENISYIKSFLN